MGEQERGQDTSDEDVRRRAYEISQGPDAGTDEQNWLRAEQELQGASGAKPTSKPRAKKVETPESVPS